jgi:hypothetical protein
MLEADSLEGALYTLGGLLEARGHAYEIVVVGGSALLLLGLIRRPTRDLDVLALIEQGTFVTAQPLPADLGHASRDVAAELGLAPDWLNPGPTSQIQSGLPEGFEKRLESRPYRSLTVHVASRLDHIYLKLFATVDQWPNPGKHADDLRRLRPTREELLDAAQWVRGQDIGPEFPMIVAQVLRAFGVEDAGAHP